MSFSMLMTITIFALFAQLIFGGPANADDAKPDQAKEEVQAPSLGRRAGDNGGIFGGLSRKDLEEGLTIYISTKPPKEASKE
jgi:hypothetical protein